MRFTLHRAVFIIGPDARLKLSLLYPATTGRNFDEILRVIDSLQLTATKKVATPVDWRQGGSCMVSSSDYFCKAKNQLSFKRLFFMHNNYENCSKEDASISEARDI